MVRRKSQTRKSQFGSTPPRDHHSQSSVSSAARDRYSQSSASDTPQRSTRRSNVSQISRPRRKTLTPTKINLPKERRTRILQVGTKKYKINVTTLQSIRSLQSSTSNCIPKQPFARLIKEIFQEMSTPGNQLRVQSNALLALQISSEMYLTHLFEDSNLLAQHAKRITVMPIDMKLIIKLRGEFK